jgi:predicted PurR-regulated permease PerM
MYVRRVLVAIGLAVAIGLGLLLLWQIQEIVILLVIAIILGAGIRPPVLWLKARGVPPVLAVLLVYLAIGAVLALLGWLIVPPFVAQARSLVADAPDYARQVQERFQEILVGLPGDTPVLPEPAELARQLGGLAGGLTGGLVRVGVSVVGTAFSLLLLLVMTLYWITERETIIDRWLRVAPEHRRARIHAIWHEIDAKLGAYVRGQLALGVIIGIVSFIVLNVLGIPYPLPLAVIAGITELIPIIGPIIGAIPAVLIAFSVDPLHAGLVALAYLLIQQLEGNVLVPIVMKRAVGLSPLTILLSILVGTALLGIVGAILAVPVASIVSILLDHTVFRHADAPEAADASPPPSVAAEREVATPR